MRNILMVAAVMVGLGTFMAQMADKITLAPASATSAPRQGAVAETIGHASSRSLSIPRDARGHFQTEGRIEGQRIGFMVDTGASVVALRDFGGAIWPPAIARPI
jgi:aspartyl protease family protein